MTSKKKVHMTWIIRRNSVRKLSMEILQKSGWMTINSTDDWGPPLLWPYLTCLTTSWQYPVRDTWPMCRVMAHCASVSPQFANLRRHKDVVLYPVLSIVSTVCSVDRGNWSTEGTQISCIIYQVSLRGGVMQRVGANRQAMLDDVWQCCTMWKLGCFWEDGSKDLS